MLLAHAGSSRHCGIGICRWYIRQDRATALLALALLVLVGCCSSAATPSTAAAATHVEPSERIAALHAAAQRRGLALLRFNDARIDELVRWPHERDYSLVLLFTSTDSKCETCRHVEGMLSAVKQGYDAGVIKQQSQHRTPVYFAELWPHTSPRAYETFGVSSVPVVAFVGSGDAWNATTDNKFTLASANNFGSPDKLGSWLSRLTGDQIILPKPHWLVTNALPLVVITLCALFFAYHWRDLLEIMCIPMFWFIMAMCVYAFTMSGMHWNMIRGAPLVVFPRSGGIHLFRAGYSQTIVEGIIMAALFIGGGMTWVALTGLPRERVPLTRVLRFALLAIVWTMIWCWTTVIYTITKNRGYSPISYALF